MLTYLHPSNQGPDVGKFKSEFPSNSKMSCQGLLVVRLDVIL